MVVIVHLGIFDGEPERFEDVGRLEPTSPRPPADLGSILPESIEGTDVSFP